jgi:hypothetical protein
MPKPTLQLDTEVLTHIPEVLAYQNIRRLMFISYIGQQSTYLLAIISNPWSMDPGCLISRDTEQEAPARFPLHIHNLTKMTSNSHTWLPFPQLLPREINKLEESE